MFDVPVEAEVLVALASEKLPGVTGVVVGAELLNANPDPPKRKKSNHETAFLISESDFLWPIGYIVL